MTRPCPRIVALDDLPWILDLAERRYPAFDRGAAHVWLLEVFDSPSHCFLTDSGAVILGQLSAYAWAPGDVMATMLFLLGPEKVIDPFACLRLIKLLATWAKANRASELQFGIRDDVGYDLAPLARRLGAEPVESRSFRLSFQE